MSKGYSGLFNFTQGDLLGRYNQAGSKSVKKVNVVNTTTDSSVPMIGVPNSVTQKKDENGKVITERYYDENGNAYLDIDYTNHGNPKTHPTVPHEHEIIIDPTGKPHRGKWKDINK